MIDKDDVLNLIDFVKQKVLPIYQILIEHDIEKVLIDRYRNIISYCQELNEIFAKKIISINYINQFYNNLQELNAYIPINIEAPIQNENYARNINLIKIRLEDRSYGLEYQLDLVLFNLAFFKKLDFFTNNIIAIGANGSGKTTLSNELKKYLPKTGVSISAQKILIIPTFNSISDFKNTNQKLKHAQSADKSSKVTYLSEGNPLVSMAINQLATEFHVLLDNLYAERYLIRNNFFSSLKEGETITNIPITRLDKVLAIWNSLIQHRVLEFKDGINLTLSPLSSSKSYAAYQMSDGEKVALYLIANVLQAPESGFVIIDEPEMYLHKTILKKLWDILEQERKDCIFIYLTHDLDFATSRTAAKKIWIKSYTYPDNWDIEDIPENDLPESLLLELLGSRKNILFCEGSKESIDSKIYNIIFPNYTITPVDTCSSVISYTKAFNKLPNMTTKAYGLIDSDHHGIERLRTLEPENIFSFSMTEPENLFFDEDFLKLMASRFLKETSIVDLIKSDVIESLKNNIEIQTSHYITAKINYYFKDTHLSKGNTIENVNQNYNNFTKNIKIDEWYRERKLELQEIIETNNYSKALSIFNNKGLKTIANKHFKMSDFMESAIKFLQSEKATHEILLRYFPEKIKNKDS
jgi:ABC-type cobalamin/Fe3+-siderophores transport system ATPase subunit